MESFKVKHRLTKQLSKPTSINLPRKDENNDHTDFSMNVHNSQKTEYNPNISQLTSEEMNKL